MKMENHPIDILGNLKYKHMDIGIYIKGFLFVRTGVFFSFLIDNLTGKGYNNINI